MAVSRGKIDDSFIADESFLLLAYEFDAPLWIIEEPVTAFNILNLDKFCSPLVAQQTGRYDQITGISETSFLPDLGQERKSVSVHVDFFLLRPYRKDLLDLIAIVRVGTDDDHSVQEVQGESVRRAVGRTTYPRMTSVASHDYDWRQFILQCSIDVGETFDIQHVHLVDKQYARDNFGFAFLFPFSNFDVDLISNLASDLARIAGEEGEETL